MDIYLTRQLVTQEEGERAMIEVEKKLAYISLMFVWQSWVSNIL